MVKRVFFKSFFITLGIMLACYRGLYFSLSGRSRPADTNRTGVPINRPGPGDSRTLFAAVGDEDVQFFFIVKFNGFANSVSVISLSPSYILPSKGRSLSQSMQMAGVLQRVVDVKEEFGINVDNYLSCTWDGARELLGDFTEFGIEELGESLPPVIKTLLLKSRENLDADSMINAVEMAGPVLDNRLGLGFINEGVYLLIKYNIRSLCPMAGRRLKANHSGIDTNINTGILKDYERVINFIEPTITEYHRRVITADEANGPEIVKEAVKE